MFFPFHEAALYNAAAMPVVPPAVRGAILGNLRRTQRLTGMALAPRSKPPLALGWRIMLHFGAAVAAGLVFAACVLAGNLAGLRDLLAQSPQPFTGLVFALGAITAFAPATFLTFVSTITHAQDAQP